MTMDNTSSKNIHFSIRGKGPLKKVHRISNKTLIVIDEALVKLLSINENSTWVEQQATENGILLKVHHFDTEKNNQSINNIDKNGDLSLGQ